ncbi:hypothetical protein ID858_12225 [Xenorhabdus sp. DI]|uniref:AvrD family protein n=1 Tax=Xenorhabdus doucetiae TaxID=351671 RepID=UPI001984E344|nr:MULTISPECIES: AvrD family protein [unclassified Xenorhabdus]MBD2784465.1 hypothetical protein [Xenorhabdus sp. 3]MBD2789275.1 hypothetical protein [Xenorhabdus sp. DI]
MKKLVNADSYLGPSESRFFSSGYKKVNYVMKDERILENNYSSLLTLIYPENWSVKIKKNLQPHLSSIDVILMSTNACGKLLRKYENSYYKITSMIICSSLVPVENLANIPVKFSLGKKIGKVYFQGKIGNMHVQLGVEKRRNNDQLFDSNFSRDDFKDTKHEINNISLKNEYESEAIVVKTINGKITNNIDYIDAFVSSLQIGQILLYELDNISREKSNNLWMRSIKINETGVRNYQKAGALEVVLENTNLITKGNDKWRSADIVSNLNNIHVRCSVAHQLTQ